MRSPAARGVGENNRQAIAIAIGMAIVVALVGLDLASSDDEVFAGLLLVAPIAIAPFAGPAGVAAVAGAGLLAGIASGLWNEDVGSELYWTNVVAIAIGGSIAVFAAHQRSRLMRKSSQQDLLGRITEIADRELPPERIVERFNAELVPQFADICVFDAIVDGELRRIGVTASGPEAPEIERDLAAHGAPNPRSGIGAAFAVAEQAPQHLARIDDELLDEMADGPDHRRLLERIGPCSAVIVPLSFGDRTLGAVTLINSVSGRHFSRDEFRFFRVMAGRAALVLENAGLFARLSSVEQEFEAVLDSLADAVTVQDRSGRLVYANAAAARLLGCESREEVLRTAPEELADRFDSYTEDGRPLDPRDFPGRRVLDGEPADPLVVRSVNRQSGEESWRIVRSTAIEGPTGRRAVNLIEDITETKRAEVVQRMLADAGEALVSSLDYEETLRRVARMAVPAFADWCAVSLSEDGEPLEQVAVAHADPAKVEFAQRYRERYPPSLESPPIAQALATRRAVTLELTEQRLRELANEQEQYELLSELGLRTLILAPMFAGERLVGTMAFVNSESNRRFTPADREVAEELARRAAVAIDNARLHRERSNVARTLERALVPPELPEIPGWKAATMYQPASVGTEVGGDFFDAFEVSDGWMVVIGDVCGRGVTAASLTALARYTIRTAGALRNDPVAAVEHLNRWLFDRDELSLCTVGIALLHDSGHASVICAGHPPPLLVRGGRSDPVEARGAILGAFEEGSWTSEEVELAPGDHLVLYTDGIVELPTDGGRFGERKLRDLVAEVDDAEQAVNAVRGAVDRIVAGRYPDDMALVALGRVGDRGEATAAGRRSVTAAGRAPTGSPG